MPVERKDNSREALRRYDEASRMGLAAAGNHLRTAVVKAFGSSYYKGGAFRSTLQVKQSIRTVGPTSTPSGYEMLVGTKLIEALYWELGHRNLFTRKYERVELWVPTATREIGPIRQTFARVIARFMGRA